MLLTGADPTQSLSITSVKLLVYPDQLLLSVMIRISELRAFSPALKEVSLTPVGTGKYRLIVDFGSGKKGTWDFTNVAPGSEAYAVTLVGSWTPEESGAATKIRVEVLKLQTEYQVSDFRWTKIAAQTLPASEATGEDATAAS